MVLAEYPSLNFQGKRALDLLGQTGRQTPLIFLIPAMDRETAADPNTKDAADCVEMENVGHLPAALRRVLRKKHCVNSVIGLREVATLRGTLPRVGREPYIWHMPLEQGRQGHGCQPDVSHHAWIFECDGLENRVEPIEIDWKRRGGAALKVRLSGREVQGDRGSRVTMLSSRMSPISANWSATKRSGIL